MSRTSSPDTDEKAIKQEWREMATDETDPLAPLFAETYRRRYGEEP